MILDFQSLIDIALTACLAAIGYLYRQIVEDQKQDRQMINDLRVDLPSRYVSKDDLMAHLQRIESMLNKIFERLEQKADKP
jgi:hypothetical protein